MKMLRTFAVAAIVVGLAMSVSAIGASAAAGPLVVTKTANTTTVLPGGPVTYTISVRNSGDTAADNVVVTDTLNGNLTFGSGSPTPTTSAGVNGATNLSFNLGSIAAGSTATATVNATVNSGLTTNGVVNNTATAVGSNVGTATSNTVSLAVGPNTPSIVISKVPTSPTITAGGTLSYAITVRNIGGATATGVVVSDIMDPATSLISVNPSPAVNAGGTFSFNVGDLDPLESFSFTANVQVNADTAVGTVIDNNVRVTSSNAATIQAPSAVNVIAAATTVSPSPSVSVSPSVSPARTATPSPTTTTVRVVDPGALPVTGLGEVLVWVLVALLVLSLWPALRPSKTNRVE
jgi:uncharacterized repeat protein (TIGR01451 family)